MKMDIVTRAWNIPLCYIFHHQWQGDKFYDTELEKQPQLLQLLAHNDMIKDI